MREVIVRVLACLAGFGSFAVHASCVSSVEPSSILDLSHWKLTLPVDAHHGTSGEAAEISPHDLAAGYMSGYFCTDPSGGVRFWAPIDGATTDGSGYPRSELRYMRDPHDDNANWTPADSAAELSATLTVSRVPSATRKVVVGQVHGFQTNAYIKLRYLYDTSSHTGSLAVLVNEDPSSDSTNLGSIGGLPLGQPFSYSIAVRQRVFTIRVNGDVLASFHVHHGWLHEPMYFKAGSYDQASGSSSTDGGRVTFYQLDAGVHADSIFEDGLE